MQSEIGDLVAERVPLVLGHPSILQSTRYSPDCDNGPALHDIGNEALHSFWFIALEEVRQDAAVRMGRAVGEADGDVAVGRRHQKAQLPVRAYVFLVFQIRLLR